ncbi:MAG: hypothetical protein LHW64_08260 [Candidatus Cloacimonetes bacterium]|jgi:energy-coupling factor transporter ATP-binding protein EcfA2|nr:hypothetical protein [Candidatus Cloacimonadota bacterium]MCB5287785.1 hypothetical protein [Candidatus Cloacimonadota bacterium]MCK9183786.1 hypothetical protein [Candidatus Cloacimonadota bacterium]MCK9584342.1 hypothetical protein [Candidatus Cloacimonadota bacterium]MDY0230106.1 hypothetical protein [Candidatus Cloacimonadaceae bacterium]
MITLPAGTRDIWPGFSLSIDQPLVFQIGESYFLKGANGSGKSSLIHHILLPELRGRKELYVLCLQQQMHLQIYALRAQAAIFQPGFAIRGEEDVWRYLWQDLAARRDNLPVYVIADEACSLDIPKDIQRPICLIYSSHRYQLEKAHIVEFVQLSPQKTVIYA